jgi:amino acid transporter
MLEKTEILIVIIVLLFAFYLVISLGARKKGKSSETPEISRYLFGVRILIIIIAIVSLILWFFM